MKYTFIHLSDLHYQNNWEEENGLVCESLLNDIETECKKIKGEQYVMFTGDIAFAADDPEGYRKFQDNFASKLDAIGLDKSKRFSVPGNHDVARSAIKGAKLQFHNSALDGIKNEKQFNDGLEVLTGQYFDAKFEQYKQCEESFADFKCCGTGIGGHGYDLPGGLGVYCLNTALGSCAGLDGADGQPINDKGKLCVDTRHLHRWLASTESETRILLAHHPNDWLQPWANEELERTIAKSFNLVLSGHVHTADSYANIREVHRTVYCMAPALFTRKNEELGYSFITVDTESKAISVRYRQWANKHRTFVSGNIFSGTNDGTCNYGSHHTEPVITSPSTMQNTTGLDSTLAILKKELDDSLFNYSTKKLMWVERDIANIPETQANKADAKVITPKDIAINLRDCNIRALSEFGLTSVGKKIAYEFYANSDATELCVYIAVGGFENHRQAIQAYIDKRLDELESSNKRLTGIIIDDWSDDSDGRKLVRVLREIYPAAKLLLLHHIDVARDIEHALKEDGVETGECLYLWALTQARVGELVEAYVTDLPNLDTVPVTKKIINDIDTLNIFRTPQNCLMFLRLAEQAFDDSPVNRTELIHRVLFLLFYQYDQIPTYASRPDLKDCEYVLGFICEWLFKERRHSFSKHEYFSKASDYCKEHFINVDIEVLLQFLIASRILIYRGKELEFRFTYWMNYFAAHRMHHDPEFAAYILSDRRYAVAPEIVEFYTGIDRRRVDAINAITADLIEMTTGVSERTGITPEMEPFAGAKWKPTERQIGLMKQQVIKSSQEASLPDEMKHEFADRHFDRAKPYEQRISEFFDRASLYEMFQATHAAARALRNSDHAPPNEKLALLAAIMTSWKRVAQVLAVISTELAENNRASVADLNFCLDKSWPTNISTLERWKGIMDVIPDNVLNWFEDDLYSSKLGPLIYRYLKDNEDALTGILLMKVLVRRRPDEWASVVKQFIVSSAEDSFGLLQVFRDMRRERNYGFLSDAATEHINHLSALALAKHTFEKLEPNKEDIRRAARTLGESVSSSSSERKPPKKRKKRHR